ncbi:MAG: MmcQ/YjbR family DNA-binding protein [Bacteroidetes bacterium]|nr:MmcQ/YjbR family DNA-binding protein [Bacteroidota bacterium]
MNIEEFRDFCLAKEGTDEGMPFDDQVLVLKVAGKMFALTNIDNFESINLKCDPVLALELRENYSEVRPGWHMNKKHWNTVSLQGKLSDEQVYEWIDHSYEMVVQSLNGQEREKLKN